jgi:hypothetical protein
MSEEYKNPTGENTEQNPKLTIEVNKYTSLVNAVSGTKWWRFMLVVFLIGMLLFFGISVLALTIKRMYPYSDITTNGLGATTIKSEKNEVSYWLFNTASCWESSGIAVEEGDIITIRSSGKFYTAMHHLYDATKYNTNLKDKWMDSSGLEDNPDIQTGGYYRRKYRIFPGMPTGALLMQVANNTPFDLSTDKGADPDNFYFIGKERQNIYINHPGTLHFCVNDIILNNLTINEMIYESITETKEYEDLPFRTSVDSIHLSIANYDDSDADIDELFEKLFLKYEKAYPDEFSFIRRKPGAEADSLKIILENQTFDGFQDSIWEKLTSGIFKIKDPQPGSNEPRKLMDSKGKVFFPYRVTKQFDKTLGFLHQNDKGHYYISKTDVEDYRKNLKALIDEIKSGRVLGNMKLGISTDKYGNKISELQYYQQNNYKTAWLDDNLGSFLIIIEKNKNN